MRFPRFTLNVLGVVFLFGSAALAQTATGSISGVVRDESGAVIPEVHVTVTNVDTGIASSLSTDASGRYHLPSLIPGHYQVQAQVTGFETTVRSGIQVTVASNLEINLVLRVGQVTQQTVVTAEAPIVETATSTLSGLVDDQTIRELPLNGRSFDQLIALQSSSPTFRSRGTTPNTGVSSVYTVSGARTLANLFLMDGTEMVSGGNITTGPGGVLGTNMGVDAVQEFTVLSSNYSAAYGKKAGGIINIATRSGSNQIHGSAFDFLRNSHLDAKNFFDKTPEPPPFRRNNFGGALGGPIRKDQSFFFGNYEGLRQSLGQTNISTVPDANAHQGLLPGPNGQLINVGVAPAIQPYLAALFPLPNGRNFGDGTGEHINNPNQPSVQDFFLVRFDQRISDKDSFFARYNFTRANQTTVDLSGTRAGTSKNRDQILTLEEKRIYARTVNVLRFGFSRGNLKTRNDLLVPLDPALKFQDASDTIGTIQFAGNQSAAGPLTSVGGGNVPAGAALNQFEVGDSVFHYRGPHSWQFGVQFQRIQRNDNNFVYAAARGVFQFDSLANLLAARPLQFQGLAPGANDPHKAYRQIYFAPFLQDDYKILRNLTLNLGLRYELFTVPVEASGNRISNYHFRWVDGLRVVDPTPTLGSPFFESSHGNLAPRIGFAWDPFGDGKLALRGGFGLFYDQNDGDYHFFTPINLPFVNSVIVASPPFPKGLTGGAGVSPLPAPDIIDFHWKVATRVQYSFGVQRQITGSTAINASYVGSHSYHLTRELEANSARPEILAGGVFFYPAGARRIQPSLSSTRLMATDVNSSYNSLQLDWIQRLNHGLRYKISYTLGKSIDEASKTVSVVASGEATGTQNPYDRKGDRGLSGFDVRHNLVMNFTYDVPWRNRSGLPGRLMGGWQVGGIFSIQSGTPFSSVTGFNRSRDLSRNIPDRPNLKAGASNNPSEGITAGCLGIAPGQKLGGPDRYFDPCALELPLAGFYGNLGRNTLIGPGLVEVDLTLSKTSAVNERVKVDFRAEFFNLLNRANFGLPGVAGAVTFAASGAILGSAGRIQNTVTTSRQIQFGLKLLF